MPGDVLGEGRRDKRRRLIREPILPIDYLLAMEGHGGEDLLARLEKTNCGDGSLGIESSLAFPNGDSGVEDCIAHFEEELHVLVECVRIASGNKLGKQCPVSGRKLRTRSVCPILGDHLLLIV